jgi:hypothetical protein
MAVVRGCEASSACSSCSSSLQAARRKSALGPRPSLPTCSSVSSGLRMRAATAPSSIPTRSSRAPEPRVPLGSASGPWASSIAALASTTSEHPASPTLRDQLLGFRSLPGKVAPSWLGPRTRLAKSTWRAFGSPITRSTRKPLCWGRLRDWLEPPAEARGAEDGSLRRALWLGNRLLAVLRIRRPRLLQSRIPEPGDDAGGSPPRRHAQLVMAHARAAQPQRRWRVRRSSSSGASTRPRRACSRNGPECVHARR